MDWTTMSSLYGSIDDYQCNRAISNSIVSRIPTNRPALRVGLSVSGNGFEGRRYRRLAGRGEQSAPGFHGQENARRAVAGGTTDGASAGESVAGVLAW